MNLIENIYLKEWIDINYPEMIKNGVECLCELDYVDMDKFSFWLQDKIYQEAMKEAQDNVSVNDQLGNSTNPLL